MMRILLTCLLVLCAGTTLGDTMRLAVTTSFNNSGLSDVLLPQIKADTGIEVQLLIVGTGQALRLGAAGDVDAILVHSKAAEEDFIAAGHGTHRREIMYNDFVIVGPANDPAGVKNAQTAPEAMALLAQKKHSFVSRGDDSGTYKKELSLWAAAKLAPPAFSAWYKPVGAGMGASLNTASALGAYILTDRASWLNFSNKNNLEQLFSGDPELFNQYAYLPVNAARHPHIQAGLAREIEQWLVSDKAARLINGYTIAEQQLFTVNAK